jgi:phospholipid/cholesterol/gamma-HCH transport system substrate-binding protein
MNKYKYILIGFLVSLTIGIFIFGLNYLKGKNYFVEEDTYYVVYDRIEGLTNSSPVLLNGYNIGQVRDIRFFNMKKGNLIVEFVVKRDIDIPKNSIARIFSQDLMGTKAIDLIYSEEDGKVLPGDTLVPETEESLKEQVSIEMLPLKNKAEDLLKEMENAIKIINLIFNERTRNNLQRIIEELNYTAKHLRSSTASVDSLLIKERYRIHRLIGNLESITANFKSNNKNVTLLIENLTNLTDSLNQVDFKGTASRVDSSLYAFNEILSQIENEEGTLGQLIYDDSLYNTLNRSTDYIGNLAQDLRVNPKRYLHFSVFDLGRTMYVLDQDKMKKQADKRDGVYYVLLMESEDPIPLETFSDIENVEQRIYNEKYLYTVGTYYKKRKAQKFFNKVLNNYPDAQLVYFNKGQYIKVN